MLFGLFGAKNKGWQDISPQDVEVIIHNNTNVQIIDVRELAEYKEGHIQQANLIPLSQLDVRHIDIDKNKETILICRSGNRSKRACEFLASMGHTNLKNMMGGMMKWEGKVTR